MPPKTLHKPPPLPPDPSAAHARRLALNVKLSERLDAAGMYKEAGRIAECCRKEILWLCKKCDHYEWREAACKRRWCAVCSRRIAAAWTKKVYAIIKTMKHPKMLTLTMPRRPYLKPALTEIREAWKRFRRMEKIKRRLLGGTYHVEIVDKPDGWHVHMHVLSDGPFLPVAILWDCWAKALGVPHANADIRAVSGRKGAAEVAKYVAKPQKLLQLAPDRLEEYIRAVAGTRLVSTFGAYFNKLDQILLAEEPDAPRQCPQCHNVHCTYPARAGPWIFEPDEWTCIKQLLIGNLPLEREIQLPALERQLALTI